MPFAVGDVVAGRYEVQAEIGRRPLGDVYRAREREIGVEVALRVIGPAMLPDENVRQAFVAKVGRAKSFSHPNLVRVFGVYPAGDEVVVAVQWAPGQTLRERIQAQLLTADEARPLVAQAASALTHAHQHGVVLGDMHAATVVLLGQTLKVSNVGIGPALPRKRFLEAVRDVPGYQTLPPELRSGMTCDTRADVYSLAMLVVEMLTGGTDAAAVLAPEALKTVLGRALAVDALVRHTSVDALAHELDAALSGQAPRPRRPTPPIGVPLPPSLPTSVPPPASPPMDKIEDASGPIPRFDDVRPPSQETTRSIDAEELELLKGDQVTRQVPLDEIFPLRVASSETQQFELDEMIVDEAEGGGDDLKLEARPASREEDLKTDQVMLLEPDAARTTEHPRLPPPLNEDEIDTSRVSRADVADLLDKDHDPNLTPLPPPMPSSSMLTPPPPAPPGASAKPPRPSDSLVDSVDAPTKVEVREPKIEISVELPVIEVVTAPPQPEQPSSPQPSSPQPSSPQSASPPTASKPTASKPTASKPTASKPTLPTGTDEPLYGADDDEAPTRTAGPAVPLPPTPAAPTSAAAKKKRNPFAPVPPEEEARTTEHRSPPPRRRKDPFAPVTADAVGNAPKAAIGAQTADGRRKKPPRPTLLVSPIGKKPGVGPIILVALAAFIAAVAVALAISHYMQEQRLEQERREKQRLADQLNVQAEAMKKQQSAARDAGTSPPVATPIVTHPEPTPTVLPRSGACPLGAHLVTGGGKSFCVDLYEYPGGNTIPRTDVTLAEAARICSARGERLCSDSEWERACRGKGNASFPYGHTFDAMRCNTKGTGGEVAPAGTFAGCKSAVGAYDMSGNVAEWTASGAHRGGAAISSAKESRCSASVRNGPESGGVFVGFRCCAEPTAKH
ncbi:MAG: protein kinase [Myxococcales bacterium]|nr:protein kinase [Myxococcales bacterium]